ncbi:hypothetical protein Aasi_1582 [Candidatus Amoebophilus asiaticus 5a2]|uniref:Uncharacterized protein n=1 Tax=Amoebophilus asiaticus (strain 5a2) TaxID=452471 RepID=C3L4J2_AMOA5|nr:hypothetical protein Aasi_1582 [Candidatus Amoebophilus asiaticus 5a2]
MLLLATLYAKCNCTNGYIGKGEVTEAMIEDIKKAIDEHIKEHPQLNADSVRLEFSPLLATLSKLEKGEETNISLEVVDAAAELGQPAVVQAFIDIITREVQDVKLKYRLNASLEIAEMRAESDAAVRKLEEAREQAAKKEAEQKEERRKEKEKIEQQIEHLENESLQILVKRRLAEEQAEIGIVKPTQIFIPSSRRGNLRRFGEYTRIFREELLETNTAQGLTEKQQKDISYILKCINKEIIEIKEALVVIQYTKEHPGNIQFHQNYRPEHLEIANELLASLYKYKEELGQLLATKGGNLSDYEEEQEGETEEEQVAYRELEEEINAPTDAIELVEDSHKDMQALLGKMDGSDTKRRELKAEAEQLATHVANISEVFKAQRRATEKLYFNSDVKDYVNRPILEGIQKIQFLRACINSLDNSLLYFCNQFVIQLPVVP